MSESPSTAAALIIGNELLSGKIRDENLLVLARALRSLGISLCRVVIIPDDLPLIEREVRSLSVAFDLVFTSGGVGPTHDDVTIQAVARAFDTDVEIHPDLSRRIHEHLGPRTLPGHLLMARVPKGCELVGTEDANWPAIRIKNVWLLPGVPEIFRSRLPIIKHALAGNRPFISRAVYTNLDEGQLLPLLDQIVRSFPAVDIGSYPKWNEASYRTKLTFDSNEPEQVDAAFKAFVALLPAGEPQRIV